MKKVIEGKRYDTETALKVCEIFEGYRGDFNHLDCTLYQGKRSKAFFLAGYGGAMTVFSSRSPDGSYGGNSDIIPLTDDQAKVYCERYAQDQVGKLFVAKSE